MKVRIYKPTKSNMQSGKVISKWRLEFVQTDHSKYLEPFLARTSSTDMMNETLLNFDELEQAIKFAELQNYEYEIVKPQLPRLIKKSYANNFK